MQYLENQLKKKEDENKKLKKETERMLLEQQIKFSQSVISQAPKGSEKKSKGLPDEGYEQSIEYLQKQVKELNQKVDYYKAKSQQSYDPNHLEKVLYDAFNNNLKGRLKFINSVHEWQRLGDRVQGKDTGVYGDSFADHCNVEDGELAHEHFNVTRSELSKIMENAYFPVVDCHEHDN